MWVGEDPKKGYFSTSTTWDLIFSKLEVGSLRGIRSSAFTLTSRFGIVHSSRWTEWDDVAKMVFHSFSQNRSTVILSRAALFVRGRCLQEIEVVNARAGDEIRPLVVASFHACTLLSTRGAEMRSRWNRRRKA